MTHDVTVVGSLNLDVVIGLDAVPAAGETVMSSSRRRVPGGKGLNQAVASARAGARTAMIGAVGEDDGADVLVEAAREAGVDVAAVRRVPGPSGTAWVMVQADGDNAIVVDAAANGTLEELTPDDLAVVADARVLVAQLEVPLAAVEQAARAARAAGVTVVLNAAPARDLPGSLLALVDVLVVNEHEDAALPHAREHAGALVVTLGADGARVVDGSGERRVPGVHADVVDTTGAGDSFTGYLAAALAGGSTLDQACARAVVAGALAVETAGAVTSIPTADRVDARPRTIDRSTEVPLDPGADLTVLDEAKILAAPARPEDRPAWRAALRRWRAEARERVAFDAGPGFEQSATAWAATAWNVAMVWLWDEAVRDWETGAFDADRLLAAYDGPDGVGGLDAVVLWQAYPVIGIDDRNQFDWYDVPGLRALVDDLHARDVRVFLDYNPWDVGTRRSDRSDADRLVVLLDDLDADGLFLDTLKEGDPDLLATLAARPHPTVLEGESRVPLARIADHQASWAQWFDDSAVPGVLRARWFEQRHMMHHTRRWNRDHRAELRSAWVNGAGVLLWDVVFSVRVDWSPHDRAVLRAMRSVYDRYADHLVRGEWEPLTDLHPDATAAGIAGSRWRLDGTDLYTLANSTGTDYRGPLLPEGAGGSVPVLGDGSVPAGSIAGVLLPGDGAAPPASQSLPAFTGTVTPPAPTRVSAPVAAGAAPPDGVAVEAGRHTLTLTWRQRETGLYETAPYVGDWKPLPPRLHQLRQDTVVVDLTDVVVDASEVTNAEYAAFLDETGWRGVVPATRDDDPVRRVDLDDARAYAAWRGARLPTEHEWQVAAGSPGFRRREPLLWQWTESEHRDGRTRWAVLKGGSWYAAEGSEWYVDGGPREPTWALRYLLTGAGTSRSATIGFRCAVDVRSDGEMLT